MRWEPNELAPDATLVHYILVYNTMNSNGTEDIGGTENQLIIVDGEQVRLEGLIAGSVYNVRVKVKDKAMLVMNFCCICRFQPHKEKVNSPPAFSS